MNQVASVCVVIPTHNSSPQDLTRALDSVYRQTLKAKEVIVVDDGSRSTRKTELQNVAQSYRGCRWHPMPHNAGPASARNEGWSLATADLVAFLDSDDWWPCNKLQLQVLDFVAPDVVVTSGRKASVEGGSGTQFEPSRAEPKLLTTREMLLRNRVATSSTVVRRDTSARFPEGRSYCEDWELWIRLSREGKVVWRDAAFSYGLESGSASLSRHYLRMWVGELVTLFRLRSDDVMGLTMLTSAVCSCLARGVLRGARRLWKQLSARAR